MDFYKQLAPFSDFKGIALDKNFTSIPTDWHIIVADIQGSTKAIQNGRYREVNTMGASSVMVAANILNTMEFPFVFGGDGATLFCHDKDLMDVTNALSELKLHSEKNFELNLRIGSVSLQELSQNNKSILVSKQKLSQGTYLSHFKGEGVSTAEHWIKNNDSRARIYLGKPSSGRDLLSGLSCRLSPIPSKFGNFLSVLIKINDEKINEKLELILNGIQKILSREIENLNPVQLNTIKWRWFNQSFLIEYENQKLSHSKLKSFIKTFSKMIIASLMLKFKIPIKGFEPKKYIQEIQSNSDYKKYDEVLRIVFDCSIDEAEKIESFLKELRKNNAIFYGIHKSFSAVVTCLVKSASDNQHIHFVDGSNGGYAMAAIQLKQQMTQI